MAETFVIKAGNTGPGIEYTLTPPTDLTGATVRFVMATRAGVRIVDNAPATIFGDPADGIVRYAWQTADTAVAGLYDAEFVVTFADGSVTAYPNKDYIAVLVSRSL